MGFAGHSDFADGFVQFCNCFKHFSKVLVVSILKELSLPVFHLLVGMQT